MFEATKVGRTIDKETYKAQEQELRTQLLLVQRELRQTDIPVVVIVSQATRAFGSWLRMASRIASLI